MSAARLKMRSARKGTSRHDSPSGPTTNSFPIIVVRDLAPHVYEHIKSPHYTAGPEKAQVAQIEYTDLAGSLDSLSELKPVRNLFSGTRTPGVAASRWIWNKRIQGPPSGFTD
jgi:hypothetical protein